MELKTPIIPTQQRFAKKLQEPHELHLEAICIFAAIGFFLDRDTYWKDQVVLPPASLNTLDDEGQLLNSKPWFTWHSSPRNITFNQALNEFSDLFEIIIQEQTEGKKVILPLSGGLDSRTQAVALKQLKSDVHSYSYEFEHGYPETNIARQIAKTCAFNFERFEIKKGYLWEVMDDLASLNQCYSDFTNPRQMAIYNHFDTMGDVFSLGHWGDVLFDSMNLPQLAFEDEVVVLQNKLLKRGGELLAQSLWDTWGLSGNFKDYFKSRIENLLKSIDIKDTNAKIRAFKSMYWAPRWTSINMGIFSAKQPISVPYYDDRMCQFICTIPEEYLKNRQLQIAYIKSKSPELTKITWQQHRPFNLENFPLNKVPYNVPYRVLNKLKRELQKYSGYPYVQRNWELQFLGKGNDAHLRHYLFNNNLKALVPNELVTSSYVSFSKQPLAHAHTMNMLLVLSKFNEALSNV